MVTLLSVRRLVRGQLQQLGQRTPGGELGDRPEQLTELVADESPPAMEGQVAVGAEQVQREGTLDVRPQSLEHARLSQVGEGQMDSQHRCVR